MIPYLTIALAVCSLFATAYMNFVRPARRRRRAAMEITPPEPRPNFAPNKPAGMTAPDGRVPRDLDRPYPRPKGGRRKLDKTCPVCGTGAETTPLDGKVLGWRAHGSCAEWLGEWQPTGRLPVPLPYSPDKSLIGYMEKGQRTAWDPGPIEVGAATRQGTTNTIHYTGGTAITLGGGGGTSEAVMDWLAKGSFPIASEEDLRRARDAIEQRRKPPGAPVITEYCTCGTKFTGTPEWIGMRLDVHRASGACPHSVKGRAADLRDLDGR